MVTPNNTSLIQTLYALQPGTTSSNPFINVYSIRDPTINDINYPIQKRWINFSQTKEWILENFNSTSGFPLANWVLLASGSSLAITLTGNTGGPVSPTGNNINVVGDGITATINGNPGTSTLTVSVIGGSGTVTGIGVEAFTFPGTNPVLSVGGVITIEGGVTYATGTRARPIRTNSLAAGTLDLEIQLAGSNAAVSTPLNFGVAQFDFNQFSVVGGFVQLKGGGVNPALTKVAMQTGTSPVVPDGTGLITFNGALVAAGTNPVRTDGTSANTMALEVQTAQAIAATNAANVGLAAFNSAQFTVDANGFVTIIGGGGPIDSLTGDTGPAVGPDGTGNINIKGQNPANSSGVQVNGGVNPNELDITMFSPFTGDFSFLSTSSFRNLYVESTDNTSSSSNAWFHINSGGTSGGFSALTWAKGSVRSYSMGMPFTSSEKLVITTANTGLVAPTTGTVIWDMDPIGARTMPLQPLFRVALTATQNNVTGDGTQYTIPFNFASINQGSYFNLGTSIFTAPKTGNYLFTLNAFFSNLGAANTQGTLFIVGTVGTAIVHNANYGVMRDANNNLLVNGSIIIPLSATQTCIAQVKVFNGAKTVNLLGGADQTTFQGVLLA